jgi:hypothetical protein
MAALKCQISTWNEVGKAKFLPPISLISAEKSFSEAVLLLVSQFSVASTGA